jgi:Serine/threonine protein kinase
MLKTSWPHTTTCPSCSSRYYLCRANVGHRTVCQKCGAYFHMLPPSEEAPTIVVPLVELAADDISLVGRLWLDLRPSQIVAENYQVTRFLGRGGLSQVFQVLDLAKNRYLALKLPLPATLDRLPQLSLVEEARAWLKPAPHPNLVTCEGVLVLMKHPAILMEYIDGLDLSRLMEEGRGPIYQGRPGSILARLLDIFIQVARGLKYAHSLDLTNLDIKPRNILVEKGGRAVIGDYGPLCPNPDSLEPPPEEEDPASRPALASDDTRVSATRLMGTHQYFSPELALGLPDSGLGADLWALTLTALECFLGRRPWEMGSMAGRALEHYLAEFQPRVIVPPPLADFFRKALAEKPEVRHQSAAELEEELISVYKQATKRPYLRPESVLEPESPKRMQMKEIALKQLQESLAKGETPALAE